jgi:hypothetical protein
MPTVAGDLSIERRAEIDDRCLGKFPQQADVGVLSCVIGIPRVLSPHSFKGRVPHKGTRAGEGG